MPDDPCSNLFMSYYTSLLNGNMYDIDDIVSSQIPIQSQVPTQIPQFSTQEPTQQKKGRANNFSIEEDMLLISAWQNISLDPIQGSNQTHQTYWNRIAAYYEENKKISSERTPNSLSHRWSAINTSVSKFIGYYNQIEGRNQSGLSEKDKVCEAMKMYSDLQKKAFQLIHCWTELRHCPKFSVTMSKKPKKSLVDSPASSASAQSPVIVSSPENEEKMERPMGKKAAKRLKKNEHDAKGDEFIKVLSQVKDSVGKFSEARHEAIQQLISLEKERLKVAEERERAREERERAREEREKQAYEMSILAIDTSTMETPLAEYYISLKNDILKKRVQS